MKTISLLLGLMMLVLTTAQAQIKVKPNGRVGVGTLNPATLLHLYGNNPDLNLDIKSSSGADWINLRFMVDRSLKSQIAWSKASEDLRIINNNKSLTLTSAGNFAIGKASASYKTEIYNNGKNMIFHPDGQLEINLFPWWSFKYDCSYIGSNTGRIVFWNGDFNDLYAKRFTTTSSFHTVSDKRLKENINPISNALDKVLQIEGISFNYKAMHNAFMVDNSNKNTDSILVNGLSARPEPKKEQYGIVAQDLEKVLPGLVSEDIGIKTINYDGVIPYLIEAIKEQQQIINRQQVMLDSVMQQVNAFACCKCRNHGHGNHGGSPADEKDDDKDNEKGKKQNQSSILDMARLSQNDPNPFSEATRINYYLPNEIQEAHIIIYDMQGKQIKTINIAQTGNAFVEIDGGELTAGTYLYSLVVDGKRVGVRRMILTR